MSDSLAGSRQLVVALTCKDGHRKVNVDLSPLLVFGRPFAERLGCELASFSRGRALPAGTTGYMLARWGVCIANLDIDLTGFDLADSTSFDELHLVFLEWFFTKNPSVATASLQTLKMDWNRIGNFVRYCQKRGALPHWEWFALPTEDATASREGYVRARPREFIGQPKLEIDHSDFFARIACTRSLAISTNECLEQLSSDLRNNLRRIEDACYRRIDAIQSSFEEGERLAASADIEHLSRLESDSRRELFLVRVPLRIKQAKGEYDASFRMHVFTAHHPNGLANLLWWVKNRCDGYPDRLIIEKRCSHLIKPLTTHDPRVLRRLLGVLRYEDLSPFVTAIACRCREAGNLSTILHMRVDGLTQMENGGWRIISDKNRAHEERTDPLDPRLARALLLLRRLTMICRRVGREDPYLSEALFLGWRSHQQRGLPLRLIQTNLAGKLLRSMLSQEPDLADLRLTTYSMIRNSHAVLEYIRSDGDWTSVARALGNSISTSMRHYVPPEIKTLLRERKVRQHQNEMLYVASVGQAFDPLLAVDLTTREEVEAFLAQSLKLDASKTNILLRMLANKLTALAGTSEEENPTELRRALLAVSERNLALLFRYDECLRAATLPTSTLDRPSTSTGIAPAFWRSLAEHVRALFGSQSYENLEHKAIFKRSLDLLPSLRNSVAFSSPW